MLFHRSGRRLGPLLRGLGLGHGRLAGVISGWRHYRPTAGAHFRQPGFRLLLSGMSPRNLLFSTLQRLKKTVPFRG